MKLTKGKITKLYKNKNNKQTLRKKVNKKNTKSKSKTFRRKRKVNLARKSLKRFKYNGGNPIEPPKTDENDKMDSATLDKNVELSNQVDSNENIIIDEREKTSENEVASIENDDKETSEEPFQLSESEVVENPNELDVNNVTEEDKKEELVMEPEEVVQEDKKEELVMEPEEIVQEDKKEEVAMEPEEIVQEDKKEELVAMEPEEVVQEDKKEELAMEPEGNAEPSSLPKAFDEVVEFLTDKVAERVKQDMNEGTQQNGFESVNKASETMANMGGAKKGTRKFRLVKNRKQ